MAPMRASLLCLCFLLLCPLSPAEDGTAVVPSLESHADIAHALTDLLRRTAEQLEGCTDTDTVLAALPVLQSLREEAAELMARQASLPEPTVQDYMAAQNRANDFLDAKRAIQRHISRLQEAGLMTPEMRKILGIAPETAEPND